jgi:hypothetical protein
MRIPGRWMVLLIPFVALWVGAPGPVAACDCCACDVGGDIECYADTDCEYCLGHGGTLAANCSACNFAACNETSYCSGDPQECFGQPTRTPTPMPTPTPLALGDACTSGTQCASTFCAPGGVCCNAPCTAPAQSCTVPGSVGLCQGRSPAPAMSRPGFILVALLLTGAGVWLARRRIRSSGEFR